ncbi:MAG: hypothetical protein LBL66_02100 [Clostridiales bacterium]|jgi:hypothetical protein|nr:hypothetical protein [Clostridiales bacterium]
MFGKKGNGGKKPTKQHFRRGKSTNKGHPTYIYAKVGNELKYVGITHAEITDGTKNIKLDKNPNPDDNKPSYIRPAPDKADISKFGRRLPTWKFAETDKGKVKSVIKKDKDKKT